MKLQYFLPPVVAASLTACLLAVVAGAESSAAQSDWIDLQPGKDLKGWRRVAIAPDTTLSAKDPWSVDESGRVLRCDGAGVKEMLLHEAERGDGIFHVEWRFRKVDDKAEYNAGIYVRSALDGKTWCQAQVAHLAKPPRMGDLFTDLLVDGKVRRLVIEGQGSKHTRSPGEWNTTEVTCKGPAITVTVNGQPATTWDACPLGRGHVGLQAEYFYIEFRNLKYRPLE